MTRRLTEVAHEAVRSVLRPGDLAVDATAGNGHDTVFLAHIVGPTGRVFAFDIQSAAIQATRERLQQCGCGAEVELIEGCHSTLGDVLPRDAGPRAAMFNLGYLPGSDKAAVTRPATTLPALVRCFERVAPGGIVSVMAYRGHVGGDDETASIAAAIGNLDATLFSIERHDSTGAGPVLWLITRN